MDKIYIVKNLAPWMIDELLVFSKKTNFKLILLRDQKEFYLEDISMLEKNGVLIKIKPFAFNNIFKKVFIGLRFIIKNLFAFKLDYNFIIGVKSIIWFFKLDLSNFNSNSIIHSQFATQPALISLLIKEYYSNQPKISFTFHAHDIYFKNKWLNILLLKCQNAFSISKFNINYVKKNYLDCDKIDLSRLGVVKNKEIENHVKYKKVSDNFTVGFLSWFVEKKGIEYLLNCILKIKEEGYDQITFIIAGDGPLKDSINDFIEVNNLQSSVEYIGKVQGRSKIDFFNKIDVFILPSITLENDMDGIPVVLMEAIMAGIPIISTQISGIPEICINDYNGILIEEKNVRQMFDAIVYLYKNPEMHRKYSKNALILSTKYDIEINSISKLKKLNWI